MTDQVCTASERPRATVATVVERAGRFLLVVERIHGRLVLNQPAGHLDPGESLLEAAVRETREEAACVVQPTALLGIYQWFNAAERKHFLRFTFCARLIEEVPEQALDTGIEGVLWLSPQELFQHAIPMRTEWVGRSVRDCLDGVRYPLDVLKGDGFSAAPQHGLVVG